MLLHRVVTHFRKQEWTAIGIDFVIGVVGVFFGIQVSTWNDERLRSETARTYIQRIRKYLRAHLDDFDQGLAYFGQVRTSALGALGAYLGEVEPDDLNRNSARIKCPLSPIPDLQGPLNCLD